MVVDAVRAYFEAVNGLTELTRKRAVAAAKVILKSGDERWAAAASAGESAEGAPRAGSPIQTLAGELIETSQANREALNSLVSSEVERALERLELVSRADYDRLARRVAELERRLAAQRAVPRSVPGRVEEPPADGAGAPATARTSSPAEGAAAAASDGEGEAAEEAPVEAPADVPAAREGRTEEESQPPAESDVSAAAEGAAREPAQGDEEQATAAGPSGGSVNGQTPKKKAPAGAKSQQRSTKTKTASGRSGAAAKSGGAKRTGSRGKNSSKNDQ
ncbi:membrane fusogenic activity family protein [Streptomonospora sp. PA3]|uniref:membrane fusogenic activity family protein n=1 Tax=Streptomonospora sp. PA3 TaxID=2607326 RepID=UPI0012DC44A2|nr:membrane fusogenic activity family protein [Streptomonospora sp. PA3]